MTPESLLSNSRVTPADPQDPALAWRDWFRDNRNRSAREVFGRELGGSLENLNPERVERLGHWLAARMKEVKKSQLRRYLAEAQRIAQSGTGAGAELRVLSLLLLNGMTRSPALQHLFEAVQPLLAESATWQEPEIDRFLRLLQSTVAFHKHFANND